MKRERESTENFFTSLAEMSFQLKMPAIGASKRKRPGRVAFLLLTYDYATPISSTSKMRVESPGMPVCMLFYPLFHLLC